ncbi:hypothetical protein F5Y06DRAFT_275765 [Hypoxylon sp. FL0890]|nr:hypothetical protein F5Y06DRAFT_275765 [Hypoxylon sp. FL0890]
MSSMLKKTGGLSFKPKVAPRRPGGAASSSQAPPASASSSTTPAPAAEASSQASTPAPSVPPVPAVAPSVESSHEAGEIQKEAPKEVPKATVQRESGRPSIQLRGAPRAQPESRSTTTSTTTPTPAIESTLQANAAPNPAPTEKAPQSTPVPVADEPQRSLSVSVPTAIEPLIHPTPTPEVLTSRTPPISQQANAAPSTSSATPAISTQPLPTANAPTPSSSAPTRNRVAPPTAPPSPAPVSDTIAVSAPVNEPPANAPKKRGYKRKSTTADNGTGAESSTQKRKRQRRIAARTPAETTETTETTESSATPAAEGEGEAAPPKRGYRRRRRSPTPEDAENQVVDHSKTKMGDLTRDLGIGKRFKHADAIEERAREARERFRRKKLEKQKRALGIPPDEDSASRAGTPAEDGGENGENGRESALARARDLGASVGANAQSVGYEVVDGQIIINQQSLVVDRHAAHRNTANLETVEEDEFSHLTTSSSYRRESRKTGPNHWTDEDTEKFYRLLGMFGTDFETISAMFPEKSRRAVKLKFNREENLRPRRINATVMVRGEKNVNIDLEEYKAHQKEWQESDKIMAEHAKLVKEHNEDLRRLKEERRAQGLYDEEDEQQENGENGQEGDGENTTTDPDVNEEANMEASAVGAEMAVEA